MVLNGTSMMGVDWRRRVRWRVIGRFRTTPTVNSMLKTYRRDHNGDCILKFRKIVGGLCHRGLFLHIFLPFLSNFKTFFLSFHTLMTHEHKTRHKKTSYWYKDNKHRLHCTQDRSPQDGLTASSYRLVLLGDTWTPTITADAVQVFYSHLSLLIPLPDDESSSEVPLSGRIGGGVKISPT